MPTFDAKAFSLQPSSRRRSPSLAVVALVPLSGVFRGASAEQAQVVPRPTHDEPLASAPGSERRPSRRRLLLGRAGRLPAREGRDAWPSPAIPAAKPTPRTTRSSAPARPATRNWSRSPTTRARSPYGKLLQIFFSVAHDPTQVNRQGPDSGTQYRSAIFAAGAEQAAIAKDYIAQLDKAGVFAKPIATEVSPLNAFYPAEDYHQDYATLHPGQRLHLHQRPAEDRESEGALPGRLARQAGAGERRRELSRGESVRPSSVRAGEGFRAGLRRWRAPPRCAPPPSPAAARDGGRAGRPPQGAATVLCRYSAIEPRCPTGRASASATCSSERPPT